MGGGGERGVQKERNKEEMGESLCKGVSLYKESRAIHKNVTVTEKKHRFWLLLGGDLGGSKKPSELLIQVLPGRASTPSAAPNR